MTFSFTTKVNDVVRVEPTETGAVDSDWHSTMDTAFRRFDTLHQHTHCDVLLHHGEAFAVDVHVHRVPVCVCVCVCE